MSPFFIKFFKSANPCPLCPVDAPGTKATKKSMCASHLAIARLSWRIWADERRRAALCISCSRKAMKENCRCKSHREQNRQKCLVWTRSHADIQAAKWAARKKLLATGFCICSEKNPLRPGRRRCDTCNTYQKAIVHRDWAVLREIRTKRQEAKQAKRDQVVIATKNQLAQMGYVVERGGSIHKKQQFDRRFRDTEEGRWTRGSHSH